MLLVLLIPTQSKAKFIFFILPGSYIYIIEVLTINSLAGYA